MSIEEVIHMGMVHGAPFPDLYGWTWGEILEYVACARERRKEEMREQAQLYFSTVLLHANMLSAKKDSKFSVMDAYSFLWSDKERAAARAESLKKQLADRAKRGMTADRPEDPEDAARIESLRKVLADRTRRESLVTSLK